jgi:chromosome segregation ATPase
MSKSRGGTTIGKDTEDRHPVFSDYSHIASNVGSLTFAVGLRCDDPDVVVSKMLPLTKVVHAQKQERKVRKVVESEERICTRVECMARAQRLDELQLENEPLRANLKIVEARSAAAKNKVALTENANAMVEEKNDELRAQIDDTQLAIQTAEAEAFRGDSQNQVLRNQLTSLQKEIEKLKAQTDEKAQAMQHLKDKANQEVVFKRRDHSYLGSSRDNKEMKLIAEVTGLPVLTDGNVSDDDC